MGSQEVNRVQISEFLNTQIVELKKTLIFKNMELPSG